MIRKSITNMFAFCILAIPIISSADDIELLVDKSMGQKALNAVDFPLEVRFPLNRASLSEETYSLGEADIGDIEFLSPGQDINLVESSDLSEAFEKAILSTVKSYRDGSLNIKDLESDERKAIELISKAIPSDQPTDIAILQGKDGDGLNKTGMFVSYIHAKQDRHFSLIKQDRHIYFCGFKRAGR